MLLWVPILFGMVCLILFLILKVHQLTKRCCQYWLLEDGRQRPIGFVPVFLSKNTCTPLPTDNHSNLYRSSVQSPLPRHRPPTPVPRSMFTGQSCQTREESPLLRPIPVHVKGNFKRGEKRVHFLCPLSTTEEEDENDLLIGN